MEFITSLRLIHRSENDIITLILEAGVPRDRIKVIRDATGLALLCTLSCS
jgi:hypothetical protein